MNLSDSKKKLALAGAVPLNGKAACIICIVVCFIIAFTHKREEK